MRKYRCPLLCVLAILLLTLVPQGCKIERRSSSTGIFTPPFLDSCALEPDHQYHMTLPDQLPSNQTIPLVIVLDPHGDGLTALEKFRKALKDLPIAIAASEKIKNNYEGFELSLKHLHQDIMEKYPIDSEKVIVAGFSGGARMVLYYGMQNPVSGIIMFGAGPGQLPAGFHGKKIYAVSGTRDFNFIEQYRPLFSGIRDNSSFVTDYFRGIHSWPPERYIREAVVYCLREDPDLYQHLSHHLSGEFLEEYDSLQNAKDLFFAGKALEKAWYFATSTSQRKELLRKINTFANTSEWTSCQTRMETYLKAEDKIKRMYAENLTDPRVEWWTKALNSLFAKISHGSDAMEEDYYYRLKGFLGIYLYSQINELLLAKNTTDLMDRLLEIYERVEPQSEDLVHFKAELSSLREMKGPQ